MPAAAGTIPRHSPVRAGFAAWLEKHLSTAAELGLDNVGMPASSDNTESLFGVAKRHGTGEIKDACRIALRIPALCGALTREDARNVLNVSVKEQEEITASLPSLVGQRRQIPPNPGSLDKILSGGAKQTLELVPGSGRPALPNTGNPDKILSGGAKPASGGISGSENRSKKQINPFISDSCEKTAGPPASSGKQARSPPKTEIFKAAAIAA
ncbi:MAG: hypothetical protein GY862_12800 [Gammaproteobacteria bacterium]|nr:hypothetical protein [Gammaproteobacteria bacterium]